MIKFIEFLGRLVVRGYTRAASLERKVSIVEAKTASELAKKADKARIASMEASMKARQLDKKAEQLKGFFS
ncbi:hypothetical protein HOU91_gp36 [Enterobacter phage EcpYZU01]|uniref:hypothetical protein n=1 Tax=Enterobacter phage EcpYZU01 TaxID=2483604 RepID=UPI0018ACC5CF|nr:hypothetical protein HOU91_gp36 [Enterobacter phage EcpYZU01]